MSFDPAATFLLNLRYENLFERVSADPAAPEVYRCKGCHGEVALSARRGHWNRHKSRRARYAAERKQQVQHRNATIDASLDTGEDDDDRASAGANNRPLTVDRNHRSPETTKGDEMPDNKKRTTAKRAPAKRTTAAKRGSASPSRARSTATATRPAAPTGKVEAGADIRSAFLAQLTEKIGNYTVKENKSKTSTRLLIGTKAFAVVFPPRASSLLVKIPKQLTHIETGLPAGHPFRRSEKGWGLTATLSSVKDVPSVVKCFALAAAAVTPDEDKPVTAEAREVEKAEEKKD